MYFWWCYIPVCICTISQLKIWFKNSHEINLATCMVGIHTSRICQQYDEIFLYLSDLTLLITNRMNHLFMLVSLLGVGPHWPWTQYQLPPVPAIHSPLTRHCRRASVAMSCLPTVKPPAVWPYCILIGREEY